MNQSAILGAALLLAGVIRVIVIARPRVPVRLASVQRRINVAASPHNIRTPGNNNNYIALRAA